MKKHTQLFNIEVGTFTKEEDQLILKLEKSQFRYDHISELDEMKKTSSNFLHLTNIIEQDNNILLIYEVSSELRSLKNLSKENKAIRTSIAKTIIKQDILNTTNYHISLNPSNLWFYPMKHVYYVYRANEAMPYENDYDVLTKYKALLLYCLTETPYERLVNNLKEASNQNQDELIQQIIQANSVQELKEIMEDIDDFITFKEWQNVKQKARKNRIKSYIILACVVLVAFISTGLVHKADQDKYNSFAEKKQAEIAKLEQQDAIKTAFTEQDWDKAITAMDKAGYTKPQQAKKLLNESQYQIALETNPKGINAIVKQAYNEDHEKNILDWSMPSNANEQDKEKLKLEKSIVNFDTNELNNQLSFQEDEDVLYRMGQAYLENNDTQGAAKVKDKLAGISSEKSDVLEAKMELEDAKTTVADNETKLEDAKDLDDDDDNKDDKIKEAETNLDEAKEDQEAAQKTLDELGG
ncbi:MAG: conjugal transfer protein [Tetragenococcus koreensis]|nr:conjugal transfer protein [Tetragenococcus koreensis]MDN6195499.1 conjugal transfer protein [Atopostipes suicloacalis]MDN6270087.1 conjugal transfer protein [Tetragenococcus koreensis]MDN6496983.1 conjugal transfer protein [Tetragenococcus koreensis]MDN6501798.1 conjugal transfer protein [Tetragenococcus koreensis]